MKDSAEKVKEALQEARKAQTAASSAIQQASADIQSTNNLLSSVSTNTRPITFTAAIRRRVLLLPLTLHSGGVRDCRCRAEAEQRHAETAATGAGRDAAERQSSECVAEHRTDQPGRSEH